MVIALGDQEAQIYKNHATLLELGKMKNLDTLPYKDRS